MMKLNAQRLSIMPLDEYNLEIAINNFNRMEENLNLTVTDKNIGIREKNVFKIRLNDVKNNPENYMWYTTWIIVLKGENRVVGHIMLKGYPNKNGEVIIGYYMQERYRHNGYMTEALECIKQWIFMNLDVKGIIADTVKTNVLSQKLLQKIGAVFYNEDEDCYWWKLERKQCK